MAISRRHFLKTGTIVGLSAALPLSALEVLAGQQRQVEPVGSTLAGRTRLEITRSLSKEMFAALLNTKFRVQMGASEMGEMELIKVSEIKLASRTVSLETARQDCFTVLFRGPRETSLGQNTYQIEHGQIGHFDLFLVPAGADEGGQLYQATFNRLQNYNLHRLLELRRFGQ